MNQHPRFVSMCRWLVQQVWGVVRAGERETAGRPREARTIVMGSGEDETGVARHTGTERARCLNSIMVFVFVLTT